MARTKAETREETELAIKLAELFHERGLSLPTRTIYMGSEVADDGLGSESGCDAKMAERFIKNLHMLEAMSHDAISVLMDNVGGDEYHGMAIYDAIRLSPCKISILVRGHAMSMGSVILQAADRRIMSPLSTQMVHYGTWGFEGHAKNAQQWAAESRRLDDWLERMYLDRMQQVNPHVTLDRLRELLRFDTFLTAEESIKLGLADEIG